MLYVGIDIAKNKHDVAIIDSEGTIFVRHLEITNNSEGFQHLKQTLDNLVQVTGDTVQVGLEDTGHYCYNLILFLRQNDFAPRFTIKLATIVSTQTK
jgi:transposase